MADSKEELKSLLPEMKEESEKPGLKLNIQKAKLMASSSTTSWQVDAETMQTVTDYFPGLQITADDDCSHKVKRCLLLRRKAIPILTAAASAAAAKLLQSCPTLCDPIDGSLPGSSVPGIEKS